MKVWVTRDEKADGPLSSALRAAGLQVVHEPVLERRILTDAAEELARLGPDDWLVLTSTYAVDAVAPKPASVPRVAVVGRASESRALARGFHVKLTSPDGTGKTLFEQLRGLTTVGRVCYPRSSLAKVPAPWAEVEMLSPVLYETIQRSLNRQVAREADVVCVVSPSAVRAVGPVDIAWASIGPTTSAAIRELGKQPWVEAAEHTFEALAAAIRDSQP